MHIVQASGRTGKEGEVSHCGCVISKVAVPLSLIAALSNDQFLARFEQNFLDEREECFIAYIPRRLKRTLLLVV